MGTVGSGSWVPGMTQIRMMTNQISERIQSLPTESGRAVRSFVRLDL